MCKSCSGYFLVGPPVRFCTTTSSASLVCVLRGRGGQHCDRVGAPNHEIEKTLEPKSSTFRKHMTLDLVVTAYLGRVAPGHVGPHSTPKAMQHTASSKHTLRAAKAELQLEWDQAAAAQSERALTTWGPEELSEVLHRGIARLHEQQDANDIVLTAFIQNQFLCYRPDASGRLLRVSEGWPDLAQAQAPAASSHPLRGGQVQGSYHISSWKDGAPQPPPVGGTGLHGVVLAPAVRQRGPLGHPV